MPAIFANLRSRLQRYTRRSKPTEHEVLVSSSNIDLSPHLRAWVNTAKGHLEGRVFCFQPGLNIDDWMSCMACGMYSDTRADPCYDPGCARMMTLFGRHAALFLDGTVLAGNTCVDTRYKHKDIYILLYSTVCQQSFEHVVDIHKRILSSQAVCRNRYWLGGVVIADSPIPSSEAAIESYQQGLEFAQSEGLAFAKTCHKVAEGCTMGDWAAFMLDLFLRLDAIPEDHTCSKDKLEHYSASNKEGRSGFVIPPLEKHNMTLAKMCSFPPTTPSRQSSAAARDELSI